MKSELIQAHIKRIEEGAYKMRNASARNAIAKTSGAETVKTAPVGSFHIVQAKATTASGLCVDIPIYEVEYNGETVRKTDGAEARQWIRDQAKKWKEQNEIIYERQKIQGRANRLLKRLGELLHDATGLLDDTAIKNLAQTETCLKQAVEQLKIQPVN